MFLQNMTGSAATRTLMPFLFHCRFERKAEWKKWFILSTGRFLLLLERNGGAADKTHILETCAGRQINSLIRIQKDSSI